MEVWLYGLFETLALHDRCHDLGELGLSSLPWTDLLDNL